MGAVLSVLLRITRHVLASRATFDSRARANHLAILRQVRDTLEHYNLIAELQDLPPLPQYEDDFLNSPTNNERWARLSFNYHEHGTEREINFSVYNDRNLQIISGVLYTDLSISSDVQVAVHWINRRNGQSTGVNLSLPIDLEMLYDLF